MKHFPTFPDRTGLCYRRLHRHILETHLDIYHKCNRKSLSYVSISGGKRRCIVRNAQLAAVARVKNNLDTDLSLLGRQPERGPCKIHGRYTFQRA